MLGTIRSAKGDSTHLLTAKPCCIWPRLSAAFVAAALVLGVAAVPAAAHDEEIPPVLTGSENRAVVVDDQNPPTHRLAVILIDAADDSSDLPFTPVEIADDIFNDAGPVNSFFLDQSYGNVRFDGSVNDVFGWLTPSTPLVSGDSCRPLQSDQWLIDLFADNNILLNSYDHVLLLTNCHYSTAGGSSSVGQFNLQINGTGCYCSLSRVALQGGTSWHVDWGDHAAYNSVGQPTMTGAQKTIIHELAHGLGAIHDNYLDCGAAPWAGVFWTPTLLIWDQSQCTDGIYGNFFSAQGNPRHGMTITAWNKLKMGFLTGNDIVEVTNSGVYQVGPLNGPAHPAGRAAQIISPNTGEPVVYIELRKPVGHDAAMALLPYNNEVQIVTARPVQEHLASRLIDAYPTEPSQPGTDDRDRVGYLPGDVFDDGELAVTILSVGDTVSFEVIFEGDENACSFSGLPANTSTSSPISLTGWPAGGTFSGPGIAFSGFNPLTAGPGLHEVSYAYEYTNPDGSTETCIATELIFVFTTSFTFVNYNLGIISP